MNKIALPKKSVRVVTRLTPAEQDHLKACADSLGISLSVLMRRRLLIDDGPVEASDIPTASPQVDPVDLELRQREINALNRIGNNLNQLARHANQLRGATDTPALIAELQAIRFELDRTFDRITGG